MKGLIFFALLIYTSINSYIFYRGWQAFSFSTPAKITYCVVFFVFFSSFIIAMLGRNTIPLDIQKILYFLGTTWLAILLYMTLYLLVTDVIHLGNHFFRFLPASITPVRFHQIQVISGYVLTCVVLLFGYIHFTHPSLTERDIVIPKSGGRHSDLKVVAFSDLHLGISIDKERLKNYVRFINDQQPDIILVAGDMVDNNPRPLFEEKMDEELRQLSAPLGVYFCPGNHEYISGIEGSLAFLKKTNMTLLIDSVVSVDDSFWIIGRNDLQGNKNRMHLDRLVAQTNRQQPLFLLDHEPYHLEDAEKNGIDLQFSGHTHQGQLWPINHLVNKLFEVGYGYKKKGNTHIFVSSGLALWGPEFRIGTQSELVVFNVHFEN